MTNLLDLPEEVIEGIANSVDTYSIVAFSSTCNKLRRVANQRLSVHNAQKRVFGTLAAGSFASSDWDWLEEVHPSVHLQHVVVGDRGCYASTMYIGAMGEQAECDDELDDGQILQAKQTMIQNIPQLYGSQITAMVSEICHSLYPSAGSVAQMWSDYVKEGDREATILLLLARCPNLVTLKMYHPKEQWSTLFTDSFSSMTANPRENHLFGWLSKFELTGYGDPYGPNFANANILPAFMVMPTMRDIKCTAIEGRSCPWRYDIAISAVTCIDIEHSDLDAACLWNYLSGVEALQSFRYTFHTSCSFGQLGWAPRNAVLALQRYARQSLVSLELTMELVDYELDWPRHQKFKTGEPFVASLRAFESLHTIRLDSMILFAKLINPERINPQRVTSEDYSHSTSKILTSNTSARRAPASQPRPSFEDKFWENHFEGLQVRRLIDFLPASVRRLEVIGRLSEEDARRMFSGLLELKKERVPHLQRIHLARSGRLNPRTSEICKKVGIMFSCD